MAQISYNIDYGTGYYFRLGKSLDLSAHNWLPICFDTGTYEWNFFGGDFDGAGHAIKLNIDSTQNSKTWGYGLFTGIKGCVHDLNTLGTLTANHRVGAIGYIMYYGTLKNIRNYASVTAISSGGDKKCFTGGLLGALNNAGVIDNCENYGNVTISYIIVGGIVGEFYGLNSYVKNTNNYGTVIGGGVTGGITGTTTQNVDNCKNFGNVSVTNSLSSVNVTNDEGVVEDLYGVRISGIVGISGGGTTINSINYGNVTGKDCVGGINGYASRGYISNCTNYGTIVGESNYGEIYGKVQDTSSRVEEEVILKICFIDASGKNVWDYYNLSMFVGDIYNRTTDIGINMLDPDNVAADYESVITRGEVTSGNDILGQGIDRGSIEVLVKLVSYYYTVEKLGSYDPVNKGVYLPDKYWVAGRITAPTIEYVTLSYASVWNGSVATSYAGGTGTSSDPYIISTGAQLAKIAQDCHGFNSYSNNKLSGVHYKLANSIDLNNHSWTPIGYNNTNIDKTHWQACFDALGNGKTANDWDGTGSNLYTWFNGVFDGNGYTIGGLNFNNTKGSCAGLFGSVNGTIKNLNVQGKVNAAHRAGGLAYYLQSGATVENINVFVDVTTNYSAAIVGGIAGTLENSSILTNVNNYGNVTNTSTSSYRIGGILGAISTNAKLIYANNYGNIKGGYNVGGVVGLASASNTVVVGGINYGAITGTSTTKSGIGGVAGEVAKDSATVLHKTANYGAVTGTTGVGSIVGAADASSSYTSHTNGTSQTAIGTTIASSSTKYIFTINYWYENGTRADNPKVISTTGAVTKANTLSSSIAGYLPSRFWFVDNISADKTVDVYYRKADVWDGTVASGFAGGNGSKSNPYLIKTAEQFAYLQSLYSTYTDANYGGGLYFKLVNSIDLNNIPWDPIGYCGGDSYHWRWFEGHLDGNGRTIANLKIDKTANNQFGVGLFTGIAGTVKNLIIQGSVKAHHRAGGLCYYAGIPSSTTNAYTTDDIAKNATITNVYSYVDVTTTRSTHDSFTGGVIGTASGPSKLTKLFNYGNVTSSSLYAGGIAGSLTKAIVDSCCNYGVITGTIYAGGIAGSSNNATINGCTNYSTVTYDSTSSVLSVYNETDKKYIPRGKGFAGIIGWATNQTATSNCINYGNITGTTNVAGIAGYVGSKGTTLGASSVTGCKNYGTILGEKDPKYNANDTDKLGDGGSIGGIAGHNNGDVASCNNYGAVTGQGFTGGVVGLLYGAKGINAATCTSCTNSGTVKKGSTTISVDYGTNANGWAGKLIGQNNPAVV